MKVISIIVCLFGAVAIAAPAPVEPAAVDARENVEDSMLAKRGCGAGYSCISGKCSQYTCYSSGWCSWSPTGESC